MHPAEIVSALLDFIEHDAAPEPVEEAAANVLVLAGLCVSGSDAQLIVEPHRKGVIKLLRHRWNTSAARGQPLRLALIETPSGDVLVHGTCFVFPNDAPDVVAAKARRIASLQIATSLAAIADPIDFERLCSKILGLLGVAAPVVTKAARDEGVDFFGKFNPVAEKYFLDVTQTVQKKLDVWLVGQAKHYPTGQAGTPDLRHLFGSVSLARAGAFSTDSFTAKSLTLRVADPVFFLFFTTGKLSNDAWTLIDKTGIVAMDGAMLSAFLADRGLGSVIADASKFRAWLTT